MTSIRSALSVNPITNKISIRKANKIQRRSRIPNPKLEYVFKIPEDSLSYRPMQIEWGRLKACTHAHSELNAQLCHREVQERVDHAPVLSLVNSIAIFIWIQRYSHAHRC
jgi:hypothetical protein